MESEFKPDIQVFLIPLVIVTSPQAVL